MNPMIKSKSFLMSVPLIVLSLGRLSDTHAVTIRFDELSTQPANGLAFNGVTFGFQIGGVDSNEANFGGNAPDLLNFLDTQVLEGDARGTLTLDFASPQNFIAFGLGYGMFL